ncbi:MAG TPA: hypothetical protein VEG68_18435 [Terriglobales bacterium]|nr:hypothetical protein [Terriglobales bacterium]
MNPETYAEWLRRQGHHVIRTSSSYWNCEGSGVYQAFPYHWLIQPTAQEQRELMWKHHALALRYSAPANSGNESNGYHAVYTGAAYDFDVLTTKARNNVRRGLRSCSIIRIPVERYVEEGWELRVDTLARQGRCLKETRDVWRGRSWAASGLDGFEVWAAEVQNRLAATLLIFQMDNWFYLVYQQCHRDYLRAHINNALCFAVTRSLTQRGNVQGIFYGLRSLDAAASVDAFKFQMGYEARPVGQHIVFHPYLKPWINQVTYRLSKAFLALNPGNRRLAKAEGMLRQYLAQKSRLTAQEKFALPTI